MPTSTPPVIVDMPKWNSTLYKRRPKRSWGSKKRNKACDMLIAIDEPLYKTYNRDMENLTAMAVDYVQQLNQIYHRTALADRYGDIYFRIKEIRVLFDFCTECNQTQAVYLSEFTKMDTSSFCLAHVFTYRDFPAGVQGLAWKGTVCRKRHNTGFTTLLNHQVHASRDDSVMTFAHEVGHNMGAMHDEDAGCTSGFIMSESGSSSSSQEGHQFSPCSLREIHTELDTVLRRPYLYCFSNRLQTEAGDQDYSICGNGVVEGEEECDCGLSYQECSDACCYAAHISPSDLAANKSAIPCRTHRQKKCLDPFHTPVTFGLIVPWIVIGHVVVALTIILCWDWRHDRKCFKHITHAKELIRAESHQQLNRRRRQSGNNSGTSKRIYSVTNPSSPPPLPPSARPLVRPRAPPPPPPLNRDKKPLMTPPSYVETMKNNFERRY